MVIFPAKCRNWFRVIFVSEDEASMEAKTEMRNGKSPGDDRSLGADKSPVDDEDPGDDEFWMRWNAPQFGFVRYSPSLSDRFA